MNPSVIIIDAQSQFRRLLAHHINTRWPDSRVSDYDPVSGGGLPDDFTASGFNVVLLGDQLGGDTVIDWLLQMAEVEGFPPVAVIGAGGDSAIVQAVKAGADEYITREGLSHQRLVDVVAALLDREVSSATRQRPKIKVQEDAALQTSLKGFDIVQRLSSSPIANVYLGTEKASGNPTILKVLQQMPDTGNEVAFERFMQEFELIGKLDHPNIVKIFDLGVTDDHAYIAMEFCDRGSLKRRIRKGISTNLAITYLREMAGALAAIHRIGILHRDLKPTNVLFRRDGSLAVIDFGLAKQAHLNAEITGTGEIFGTPYYMSPEQGKGEVVDERSDIYSLGIIFYEMLSGEKPFVADSAMGLIHMHDTAPIPRLPAALSRYQDIIDLMLAKDPAMRIASMEELLAYPELAPV
jgi:serine/threonine protein kinase